MEIGLVAGDELALRQNAKAASRRTTDAAPGSLEEELRRKARAAIRRARQNYLAAYVVTGLAAFASMAATIALTVHGLPEPVRGILFALPGALMIVSSSCRFESRAEWWYRRYNGLNALHRELRFEHGSVAQVSRKYTHFDNGHRAQWPTFAKPQASFGRAPDEPSV
jgi:hypothetical protein